MSYDARESFTEHSYASLGRADAAEAAGGGLPNGGLAQPGVIGWQP